MGIGEVDAPNGSLPKRKDKRTPNLAAVGIEGRAFGVDQLSTLEIAWKQVTDSILRAS